MPEINFGGQSGASGSPTAFMRGDATPLQDNIVIVSSPIRNNGRRQAQRDRGATIGFADRVVPLMIDNGAQGHGKHALHRLSHNNTRFATVPEVSMVLWCNG